jgi:hypothetical protein
MTTQKTGAEKLRRRGKKVATRRAIQDEFLIKLAAVGFKGRPNEKEPWGIQSAVMVTVNRIRYGDGYLKASKETVRTWIAKMRNNSYKPTPLLSDYTGSAQNARRLSVEDQRLIRSMVVEKDLKCDEVVSIYSETSPWGKNHGETQISISKSTVRRVLKQKFEDEPSMVAAVPKAMRIGGNSAHHNRCRLVEARFWDSKDQSYIDGMWFGDESKMTFREHKNKAIDIMWCPRGTAGESNWYEHPRWPGQVNLFLVQSRKGIEFHYIYDRNMKRSDYKKLLPVLGALIDDAGDRFSCYMHDNLWRGGEPVQELNEYVGPDRWTRYMGKPCTKKHPTMRTPVRGIPVRVPKLRCRCKFPENTPIHAAYSPKTNLVEETFAKIDRQMTKNKIVDAKIGAEWPSKGSGKSRFWKMQLDRAIGQVNEDKVYFANQYATFKKRCKAHIESKGKRLKTSKW